MKKILIMLALFVLLSVGCTNKNDTNKTNNAEQPQENLSTEESETVKKEEIIIAPDFELESLDGTMFKLSELRDKNVIINFWATWCDFCVAEMPDLQKLQDTYKDDDLLILAINVGETKEEVVKFMEENQINLTALLDKDSSIANTYGLRSFPSTIAINKKGEVVSGHIGMLTYEQMEEFYKFFEK